MSDSETSGSNGQAFLQHVYDTYRSTGSWPLTRKLRIEHWSEKLEILAAELGEDIVVWEDPNRQGARCWLHLPGIVRCDGSKGDIEAFLRFLRLAAEEFVEASGECRISTEDISQKLKIDFKQAQRVAEIFYNESQHWSGAGGPEEDGGRHFDIREKILYVDQVGSLEEYWAAIAEERQDWQRLSSLKQKSWGLVERVDELGATVPDLAIPEGAADSAANPELGRMLRQDLRELNAALRAEAWKSAGILAGSCCECILLDLWHGRPEDAIAAFGKRWPHGVSLADLARKAHAAGMLSEEGRELVAVLSRWRNLVHPARALQSLTPRRESALMLVAALQMLIAYLGKGSETAEGPRST